MEFLANLCVCLFQGGHHHSLRLRHSCRRKPDLHDGLGLRRAVRTSVQAQQLRRTDQVRRRLVSDRHEPVASAECHRNAGIFDGKRPVSVFPSSHPVRRHQPPVCVQGQQVPLLHQRPCPGCTHHHGKLSLGQLSLYISSTKSLEW